jgi:hypothetical protein
MRPGHDGFEHVRVDVEAQRSGKTNILGRDPNTGERDSSVWFGPLLSRARGGKRRSAESGIVISTSSRGTGNLQIGQIFSNGALQSFAT